MEMILAHTAEHLAEVRRLFREYEQSLGVDLCFQGFEEELAGLPGTYAPPKGALLIGTSGEDVAGCVAVRELTSGVCEMKRLYVRPQFRGRGLGRQLAQRVIEEAIDLSYSLMRLDTLASLSQATRLYESMGFIRTEAYHNNPLPGVVYWELRLKQETKG